VASFSWTWERAFCPAELDGGADVRTDGSDDAASEAAGDVSSERASD